MSASLIFYQRLAMRASVLTAAGLLGACAIIRAPEVELPETGGYKTAAEEQTAVAEEINRNLVNISEVAVETSSGSEQTAQASQQVTDLAQQLKQLASQFRT